MLVLTESQVAQSTGAFDRTWASEASIVLLPDHLADSFWVQARLGLVEPDLQTKHVLLWSECPKGRPLLSIAKKSSLVEQAKTLASLQALAKIERALITLPLSEPFALVNQWIWAMIKRATRQCHQGLQDPKRLKAELSSLAPTLLCLDQAQALALVDDFRGEVFFGVKRICLVNLRDAQDLLPALRALFPIARCYEGQGLVPAMSFVSMREVSPGRAPVREEIPGVEFDDLANGQVGVRSRHFALAKIDDDALRRFDDGHCFEWTEPSAQAQRLAS